jgi:hypothetical protein
MEQENKVKLFEVSLDTKTNNIHVGFEVDVLDKLKINKEKFYKDVNNNKGLELEIRNICKMLIDKELVEDITLHLNKAELIWLSDMMCGESDGSKASDSLEFKLDELYNEFCR